MVKSNAFVYMFLLVFTCGLDGKQAVLPLVSRAMWMFGSRGVPGAPREKHNHAFYEGCYHQGNYLAIFDSSI